MRTEKHSLWGFLMLSVSVAGVSRRGVWDAWLAVPPLGSEDAQKTGELEQPECAGAWAESIGDGNGHRPRQRNSDSGHQIAQSNTQRPGNSEQCVNGDVF